MDSKITERHRNLLRRSAPGYDSFMCSSRPWSQDPLRPQLHRSARHTNWWKWLLTHFQLRSHPAFPQAWNTADGMGNCGPFVKCGLAKLNGGTKPIPFSKSGSAAQAHAQPALVTPKNNFKYFFRSKKNLKHFCVFGFFLVKFKHGKPNEFNQRTRFY